jgi:hypothetical protein
MISDGPANPKSFGSVCVTFGDLNMAILLGSIADDFAGATDLAGVLVRYGMRTVLR